MHYRISTKKNNTQIFRINSRNGCGYVKFVKKQPEPKKFSYDSNDDTIFSFSAAAGNTFLLVGGPSDKVGTKINTEPCGGLAIIKVCSPVYISKSEDFEMEVR